MALNDRIWWTYKARIRTEKRLLSNAFHAQLLLFLYSFFSVYASVYYLIYPQDKYAQFIWCIYAILLFGLSCLNLSLNYKERAALVKQCYLELGALYNNSKGLSDEELSEKYSQILALCENHSDFDFNLAVMLESLKCSTSIQSDSKKFTTQYLTNTPNMKVIILLIKDWAWRYSYLILSYSVPIFITYYFNIF